MPLVEVVRPVTHRAETFERVMTFARRLGKEPIVARGQSGLHRQSAADSLSARCRAGARARCGLHPRTSTGACSSAAATRWVRSTLLDFVGLDTAARIADIMFEEYREARYAPRRCFGGWSGRACHGRKSGKGFYDYASDPPIPIDLGL